MEPDLVDLLVRFIDVIALERVIQKLQKHQQTLITAGKLPTPTPWTKTTLASGNFHLSIFSSFV